MISWKVITSGKILVLSQNLRVAARYPRSKRLDARLRLDLTGMVNGNCLVCTAYMVSPVHTSLIYLSPREKTVLFLQNLDT